MLRLPLKRLPGRTRHVGAISLHSPAADEDAARRECDRYQPLCLHYITASVCVRRHLGTHLALRDCVQSQSKAQSPLRVCTSSVSTNRSAPAYSSLSKKNLHLISPGTWKLMVFTKKPDNASPVSLVVILLWRCRLKEPMYFRVCSIFVVNVLCML